MNPPQDAAPVVLTVRQHARQPVHLLLLGNLAIGRDCDGFILADAQASRRHAVFSNGAGPDAGHIRVRDLASANGTTCNGQPFQGEIDVEHGDIIGIGTSEIVIGTTLTLGARSDDSVVRDLANEMRRAERPKSAIMQLIDSVQSPNQLKLLAKEARGEGTFTIVFSDIEGSTNLATRLGDDAWMRVLDVHNEIIRTELTRHQGREVKSQGDGFMMAFESARRAVDFAIAVQQELHRRRNQQPEWQIRVRIGVHTGEAITTADGDLFGRHVVVASRIADHADGNEILVSGLVRDLTQGRHELAYEPAMTVVLKGLGEQLVHRVIWS